MTAFHDRDGMLTSLGSHDRNERTGWRRGVGTAFNLCRIGIGHRKICGMNAQELHERLVWISTAPVNSDSGPNAKHSFAHDNTRLHISEVLKCVDPFWTACGK